ncbi:His-Xaa-Ser system protein HxsD [Candidatus Binatia bacterium]|nr:His-Xaa-Ser system protein HxsD [Candidatus Binatia bacterium]
MRPRTEIEAFDPGTGVMTLSLDIDLYPREVLYAGAYVFLDRAYVLLDRDGERAIVHLRAKQPLDEPTLRAMAGEFENELLAQAFRHKVFKANRSIIEQITGLAIGSAAGAWPGPEAHPAQSPAAPQGLDDGRDFLDDPLGIAAPWSGAGPHGHDDGTDN